MSAQPVRFPPPAKEAARPPAAPAEAPGPPRVAVQVAASRPRKKLSAAAPGAAPTGGFKTDSISAGIRRIVEDEKRADFAEVMQGGGKTPSERSHTDREMPGDGTSPSQAGSQAASQTLTQRAALLEGGEKKPTPSAEGAVDDGGGFPSGKSRSRLEEVIKDRARSRKSWKSQQVENKKRAQLLAEANAAEDPPGQPGLPDTPGESPAESDTPVRPTSAEPIVPAKSKSNRSGKRRGKSARHTVTHSSSHSVNVREPVPTDSRSCVNPDYLALYDRLVAEEKKEFESQCRSKITRKFLYIFAAFSVFFLAVSITFAVLYFTKPCPKN